MATPLLAAHHHAKLHHHPPPSDMTIVLTPVQLTAVLIGGSIHPHEIIMNRFWGSTMILGGAIELFGAGILLATPEPTTLTKTGGVILGIHGADTLQAGTRQVYTGDNTKTLTQQGAEAAAKKLGASNKNAERIGIGVDIAVPIAVGALLAAARISAIRAGRISLIEHETTGGHTIIKHVAKTEAQLRTRLAAEPNIPAATSFTSLREAEAVISDAIRANAQQIKAWAAIQGPKPNFRAIYQGTKTIGYGVVRQSGTLQNMTKARIVLRATTHAKRLYFILTAFPEP